MVKETESLFTILLRLLELRLTDEGINIPESVMPIQKALALSECYVICG